MQMKRILVPVDLSENSRQALEYAKEIGDRFDASIDVLYVWEPPLYVAPDVMLATPGFSARSLEEYGRAEAAKDFERFMSAVKPGKTKMKSSVDVGNAAATILRQADGADLIVMGTHGRNALGRFLLGSVAHRVVSKAHCPVLTVRSPE
jgi:nucleotide-binding universal stress UspA family protein